MTTHHMDEAAFELDDEWRDHSVHIYQRAAREGTQAIVVTRAPMHGGLSHHVDTVVKQSSQKFRQFEILERRQGTVGSLEGEIVKMTFLHDSGPLFAMHAFFAHGESLFNCALTSPAGARDQAESAFDSVLSSLRFRRP